LDSDVWAGTAGAWSVAAGVWAVAAGAAWPWTSETALNAINGSKSL
jgi:hypothetical protein